MNPPTLTPRQLREAFVEAVRWLHVQAEITPAAKARIQSYVGEDSARLCQAGVREGRHLLGRWLGEPGFEGGGDPHAELIALLVPLRAAQFLKESRDDVEELLVEYRQARLARDLLRLTGSLAHIDTEEDGPLRGGGHPRRGPVDAWTAAATAAGALGEDFGQLPEFSRLSPGWRAWLSGRIRKLSPGQRRTAVSRLLRGCASVPPNESGHPWSHAIALARWLWDLEPTGAPLESLLPAELPGETLRLAGERVRLVPSVVDFCGTFQEATRRGLGLSWEVRTVSPAERLQVPQGLPVTKGVRVGPPAGEPSPGSLFKEICEVSIGVREYRMVFLTTGGERLVVEKGSWHWRMEVEPLEGVLDGWTEPDDGGGACLFLRTDEVKFLTIRGRDIESLGPAH